jgi:hypothetical protein
VFVEKAHPMVQKLSHDRIILVRKEMKESDRPRQYIIVNVALSLAVSIPHLFWHWHVTPMGDNQHTSTASRIH